MSSASTGHNSFGCGNERFRSLTGWSGYRGEGIGILCCLTVVQAGTKWARRRDARRQCPKDIEREAISSCLSSCVSVAHVQMCSKESQRHYRGFILHHLSCADVAVAFVNVNKCWTWKPHERPTRRPSQLQCSKLLTPTHLWDARSMLGLNLWYESSLEFHTHGRLGYDPCVCAVIVIFADMYRCWCADSWPTGPGILYRRRRWAKNEKIGGCTQRK